VFRERKPSGIILSIKSKEGEVMKGTIKSKFPVFILLIVLVSGCVTTHTTTLSAFTPSATSLPDATPTSVSTIVAAFSTDFNGGVPPQFSGVVTTESVQGYAEIATGANGFSGDLLRNSSNPPLPTTLTLTGLPAHASIDLRFLLAIIDSWDGDGSSCCGPDSFTVTVDGKPLFSEVFNNAAIGGVQGYMPPPGAELVRTMEMGFRDTNENDQDSGYDMGKDPTFANILHTSDTLMIEWYANGPGWQGGTDESWAIDNLEVILNTEND
jgi:hypothetical protein